jgi:hypothetical protein
VDDKPWHLREREEFEGIKRCMEVEFPYLHAGVADGQTVLRGELPIVAEGKIIDQFEIEVLVAADGPRAVVPTVSEIGGRIPHTVDRHVYPTTGNVCLFVQDEFWYRHPDGMDLLDFLKGPVTSFFVAQTHYELHGRWPFGERSHGSEGIREFYYELLGTRDKETVRQFLESLAIAKLNSRAACPCMSGKRINACHGAHIRDLRLRIRRSAAVFSLAALSRGG